MHQGSEALTAFRPFPEDVVAQDVTPFHIPAADLLQAETDLTADMFASLRAAFVVAGPLAHWRETYKGTDIGQSFMDRFACDCLIGQGGAFHSDQMWCWVVYMPRGLFYPRHPHPGEEMYMILDGRAEFWHGDHDPVFLSAGDTMQHASNEPHAMETHD